MIVGGGRGIGLTVATSYAEAGAKVCATQLFSLFFALAGSR